jgi:hypothetical protein
MRRTAVFVLAVCAVAGIAACAQEVSFSRELPFMEELPGGGGEAPPAAALYRRLGSVGLDPVQVYRIRDASIEREDLHISLNDGVIAFTQAIDGHITGAMFEGDGEILLSPPDRVERWSLSQFTGAAILEERFGSAYLRFNDETFAELKPMLHPLRAQAEEAEDDSSGELNSGRQIKLTPESMAQEFIAKWDPSARRLAQIGVLRLLMTFVDAGSLTGEWRPERADRYLFIRVGGERLGVFHAYYDGLSSEQITVSQTRSNGATAYYDVWTSFPARSSRARIQDAATATVRTQAAAEAWVDPIRIPRYTINARIIPPSELQADASLDLETSEPGHRILTFELSRSLSVKEVTLDGHRLEFVQNEPIPGSELSRRGNDDLAVILPEPLPPHKRVRLHFVYEGEVLSDAGGGLMYVGARGIWYPNRGFSMSDFDMEFRYPANWTLVATGKCTSGCDQKKREGEQIAHYAGERPMPVAGFNIGLYEKAQAKAGPALIETYAAREMGSEFAGLSPLYAPHLIPKENAGTTTMIDVAPNAQPSPSDHAQKVADRVAQTVKFLSARFGPFPYSKLAVTQIPGTGSQSWPGLLYLSGYSFLSPEELQRLRLSPMADALFRLLMPSHETAHQWFGDLLIWNSYREEWLVESLSNYCVLMMIEQQNPAVFHSIMEMYRQQLLSTTDGHDLSESGPVTLGVRLNSSRFPNAYEKIAYGRGTWLFHMLRHMLRDAGAVAQARSRAKGVASPKMDPDEIFFTALRNVRQRYEGKEITTRDLQQAFEDALPDSLRYEGRRSLEWFFDNWVNGSTVPQIELERIKITQRGSTLVASGSIVQSYMPSDFVTSVPLYAQAAKGGEPVLIGRIYAEGPDTPFHVTVPAGTHKLLLDPYQTILRR